MVNAKRFPTGGQYVDALQNTALCLKDPDLHAATPALTKLNRPKAISGNFASVFELTSTGGRRYAVKCFTREVADQERRYQAISDHLAGIRHPWKVGFQYLAQGVLVEGAWYPVLKMEWVSGVGLTRWVEDHLHDPRAIGRIAGRFAELIGQLADAGIAHGDLQHGNLLVAPDDSLRLVDYDGMYVPALAGLPAAEIGHRNYQSPLRTGTDFGPELDRFAAWVIYLSLVALAVDPGLWHQLHEPGGEHLLLDSGDFENPAASHRISTLLRHSTPDVRELAGQVYDQLAMPLARLPELRPPGLSVAAPPPPQPPPSPPRAATSLPDWMSGHLAAPSKRTPVHFSGRRPFFQVAVLFCVFLAAVILPVFGPLAASVAGPIAVSGLAGLIITYWSRPESRQKKQVKRHHRELTQQYREPQQLLARLERKRSRLEQDATGRAASFTKRMEELDKRSQKQLARIDGNRQRQLTRINRQLAEINLRESREVARELRLVQEQYVSSQLGRSTIRPGLISGIGEVAVANLRGAGISTPADFTGIYLVAGSARYGSSIAYFELARGGRVRVPGIGEAKATNLDQWRKTREAQARLTQPTALPVAQRKAIADRFATQQKTLTAEQAKVGADADAERVVVVAQFASERTALLDDQRRSNGEIAARRAESDRLLMDARAATSSGRTALQEVEEELTRYDRITFPRFIAFVITGH